MSFIPGMSGVASRMGLDNRLKLVHVASPFRTTDGNVTTFSWSGVNFGPVFPGRALVAAVSLVSTSNLQAVRLGSATIATNPASIIFDDTGTTGACRASFFGIYDQVNTTGEITVTRAGSNSFGRVFMRLYAAYNLKSLTPTDTLYAPTGGSLGTDVALSGGIDAGPAGTILAIGMSNDQDPPIERNPATWTGITREAFGTDFRTRISYARDQQLISGTKTLGLNTGISISAVALR